MRKSYSKEIMLDAFRQVLHKREHKYIAVKIETRDVKGHEVIVNPLQNAQQKIDYYDRAYTDDLVLKSYDGIKIVDYTWADSFDEIEKDFGGTNNEN